MSMKAAAKKAACNTAFYPSGNANTGNAEQNADVLNETGDRPTGFNMLHIPNRETWSSTQCVMLLHVFA